MSMTVIEHIEVGSGGASSITFSSIAADYTDLYLVCSVRNTSSSLTFDINPNGSTTNKTRINLQGSGSSASSASGTDITPLQNSSSFTSNTFASTSVYIPNYASSNNKSISIDTVTENNATTSYQRLQAALWSDTTAISSLECSTANNFAQYSSFTLYGIRKYDTAGSPKATGGIISFDSANNKWVHTFTASGTFTPTEDLTAEYLVIAGGGGSGYNGGGGGGAGGYRCSVSGETSGRNSSAESPASLTSGTAYTITVGAGGSGSGGAGQSSGGDSSISGSGLTTITSTGGGKGAGGGAGAASGGSGGGGAYAAAPGNGTANQGFDGEAWDGITTVRGAGGGAGSDGGDVGEGLSDGDGGLGLTSSITGTAIKRAGGGGGGLSSYDNGNDFGGARGGNTTGTIAGQNALPATGGGGGGGGSSTAGGSGGSGIVIVRYSA